jgi:hypothetical protein
MDRQSAEQWNTHHPKGTRVSVRLRSGETVAAETATHAQQWGEFALVTLAGVDGLWTTGALTLDHCTS